MVTSLVTKGGYGNQYGYLYLQEVCQVVFEVGLEPADNPQLGLSRW